MENRAYALAAGIFTLVLVAAGVFSLWWFSGQREKTRDYLLVSTYNVTGLNPQAQVRYRGIRVGKVVEIHLDKSNTRNILILIRVNEEVPVTAGTVARLGYQGVTGIAHVLLEDSDKNLAPLSGQDGEPPRIAMQPSLIQEVSDVGADTLRQAHDLLASANALLNEENRDHITHTLANLDGASSNLQPALKELPDTLARLRLVLSDDNLRNLSATLKNSQQAAGDARQLMVSLHRLSEHLDQGTAAGEGNLGVLSPRWKDVAADVSTSTRQLNRVLQQVEQSPQSLIFGHQAPPGPGEPGFVAPVQGDAQ